MRAGFGVTKIDREKRRGQYAHFFYGGLRAADIRP